MLAPSAIRKLFATQGPFWKRRIGTSDSLILLQRTYRAKQTVNEGSDNDTGHNVCGLLRIHTTTLTQSNEKDQKTPNEKKECKVVEVIEYLNFGSAILVYQSSTLEGDNCM